MTVMAALIAHPEGMSPREEDVLHMICARCGPGRMKERRKDYYKRVSASDAAVW